jgi:hypothetical protein
MHTIGVVVLVWRPGNSYPSMLRVQDVFFDTERVLLSDGSNVRVSSLCDFEVNDKIGIGCVWPATTLHEAAFRRISEGDALLTLREVCISLRMKAILAGAPLGLLLLDMSDDDVAGEQPTNLS